MVDTNTTGAHPASGQQPHYQSPYYNQELHGPYQLQSIGDFQTESGEVIKDLHLAYAMHGQLNADKSNAILVTTWFSGTSKIMGDVYIGKQHALNPDKYCVIVVNQIGNGLSTSPWHYTDPTQFPQQLSISDDVRAQHKLLTEHFGIQRLELVFGGSMGAQQTWEWACRYPDFVKRSAPLAGTASSTPHNYLFTEQIRNVFLYAAQFNKGQYKDNKAMRLPLQLHGQTWNLLGLSTEFYKSELIKKLGFNSADEWTEKFVYPTFEGMDPNCLLSMAYKWGRGDVRNLTNGDIKAALARNKSKMFIMPIDEDMFFPPRDLVPEQAMTPNSELRVIKSVAGHWGLFGFEASWMQQLDANLNELLNTPVV